MVIETLDALATFAKSSIKNIGVKFWLSFPSGCSHSNLWFALTFITCLYFTSWFLFLSHCAIKKTSLEVVKWTKRLQVFQNAPARLLTKSSKYSHVTSLLIHFYCLSINSESTLRFSLWALDPCIDKHQCIFAFIHPSSTGFWDHVIRVISEAGDCKLIAHRCNSFGQAVVSNHCFVQCDCSWKDNSGWRPWHEQCSNMVIKWH